MKCSNSIMSSIVSLVLCCKLLSDSNLTRIRWQALSTGMEVNNEMTSNDNNVSSSSIVVSVILFIKSVELVTE